MGRLLFDENEDMYRAEQDGLVFLCEEYQPDYEAWIPTLAARYRERLPALVDFIREDVNAMFGPHSAREITQALGVPEIRVDLQTITYLDHTLPGEHLIEVEYSGLLDTFEYVTIDG